MQAEHAFTPGHDAAAAQLRTSLRKRMDSFVGEIIFLSGELEIEDPLTKRRRPAEKGIRVSSEFALHMKHGQAAIRLDDGSDLWLNAGAVVDLSNWKKDQRSLRLRAGRMLALVAQEIRNPFRAITPFGQVLVTGTAFEAQATTNSLSVAVLHGSVEVSSVKGTARARRGQIVEATPSARPVVSRISRSADDSPFRTLGASFDNVRIHAACTSAAKLLHIPASEEKNMSQQNEGTSLKRIALILALLIPAGAGAYYWLHRAPAGNLAQIVTEDRPATGSFQSGPMPKGKVFQNSRTVIRGNDGKDVVIDGPVTPERLKELGIDAPPGIFDQSVSGGSSERVAGPPPGMDSAQHEIMSREMGSSSKALTDLIKSGVPPKEASERISKAMQESIRKQMEARGDKGPVPQVKIEARENGVMGTIGHPGEDVEVHSTVQVEIPDPAPAK